MREVYRRTTAIAMILSLTLPTLTMAQEGTSEDGTAVILPVVPGADGDAPAEPAADPAAATEPPAADEPPAPVAEPAPEAAPAPESAAAPEATEPPPVDKPATAEDAVKPTGKPEAAKSDTPPAQKPMTAETETAPAQKPETAQAPEAEQDEATPAPEPDAQAAETAPEVSAPAKEPAEEATQAAPAEAAPVANDAEQKAEPEPTTPVANPQKQAEKPAQKPEAAAAAPSGDAAEDASAAKEGAPAEASADAKAADAAAPEAKPTEAKPAEANAEGAGEKAVAEPAPANEAEPAELAAEKAPEATAPETAAAVDAAKGKEAESSDALKAAESDNTDDTAAKAEVTDVTLGEGDARRSDQDYANSVSESPDAKKKDHKARDIAALALAGLAGYAVGSVLSDNRQVALNSGDRVVVTAPDGSQQLIKNDDSLLFQPGSNVQTQKFADGSSITTVTRTDGSKVATIQDANMRILRRTVIWPDGRETQLVNDVAKVAPVRVSELPPPARPIAYSGTMSEDALRAALRKEAAVDRRFSLDQIRDIAQVRALVAPLNIESITFDTGSAAISPDQARQLAALGKVIATSIKDNPREVYMVEGYTDAVGSDASNLALSDRRAESVALALSEYFDVPPENLVVQGYGEQFQLVPSSGAERANRRVAVRRLTNLISQ